MQLDFNQMLLAFSFGLDCIEQELAGVSSHHSRRVAYLVSRMGRQMGLSPEARMDLAGCALLHDNALTEYLKEERQKNGTVYGGHCAGGEENIRVLPFRTDVTDVIRYHHENADGTGTFQKKAEETPLGAQLIHLADMLDVRFRLQEMNQQKWEQIVEHMNRRRDRDYAGKLVDVFFQEFTMEAMEKITKYFLEETLEEEFPMEMREYSNQQVRAFCDMFARIIDYKSEFTTAHSMGVARRAEQMARYYGYEEDLVTRIYFAGAVHDIGKLMVNTNILEKPGKLTDEEYIHIKNHAQGTYMILSRIKGLEDITDWASLHHEKLNGTGYPFGKTGDQLGKIERMMACVDIYQALTEKRPYKEGMSHEKTMSILDKMVQNGAVDKAIVQDMDQLFGQQKKAGTAERDGGTGQNES